jgi:hypothetical protein
MKSVATLMILSLCFATAGYSQDLSSNAQSWSILRSIPVGQDLLVKTKEGKSINGRLDRITDTSLALTAEGGTFSLNSSEVAKVYVFRGKPVVSRTLIGASIGTLAGGGIGLAAGNENDIGGRWMGAAVGGGVGLVIGSVTGLALGLSKKKELVYEANATR